jgi:hypothetical protein
MIHKARAMCKNGHMVEFGPCNKESKAFIFFKSVCTSTDHEVLSANEIQCQRCKTVHYSRPCPKCNELVPVAKFRQKTQMERLKR